MLSKEYNITKNIRKQSSFHNCCTAIESIPTKKMILFEAIITICILARANSCKSTTKTVVTAQNSGKNIFNCIDCSFGCLSLM